MPMRPEAGTERKFAADFWASYGHYTPDYMHIYVMPEHEAKAISEAADLAFIGRFGEAEQQRMKAGYHGLGLIDNGAIARESETARESFRQALDEDEESR
jgi:hypothetical protein